MCDYTAHGDNTILQCYSHFDIPCRRRYILYITLAGHSIADSYCVLQSITVKDSAAEMSTAMAFRTHLMFSDLELLRIA